ncbi:MAG TPA: hypothetical protein VLJ86_23130, partial [Ramlibacter sp.]|nr:hypothetical protein [Ramlibacter sp.]
MKALFVSYGGGHIEMCLPVMRALRERVPGCDARIMALTTAGAVARAAGESPLGFADFMDGADGERARRLGEQALAGNQHPDVSRDESVAYLGLNLSEWADDIAEADALTRFAAEGRHAFTPVRFFERVLGALQPDVVVATNSPRSEQAVVEAAARLRIPSLSMLDLFGLPGDPFLSRRVQADRITVLSDGVAANLIAAGIPAERIVVTGNPAFDALAGDEALAQGRSWRAERGWDGLQVVLWAGHREPNDSRAPWAGTGLGDAVQARLVAWALAREDVALAMRYHPNEWQDFTAPPQHPRLHWSVPGREGLTPVLMAADQVVVQATTVGVQAHAAGKRLIGLGFSPLVQRSGMDYARLGLGVRADSIEHMIELLDEGINTRAIDHTTNVHAGGAAAAVAREIAALAAPPTVRAEPV